MKSGLGLYKHVQKHPISGEIINLPRNNPYQSNLMAPYYDRPLFLYNNLFKKVKEEEKKSFNKVLDVGCGTGISTRAVKEISDHVTGIDISVPLLKRAITEYPADPSIEYIKSPAEALPFLDKTFDLVTCCVAIHWLDQQRFLKEASRVLKDKGKLIIFNYQLKGLESPEYDRWKNNVFLKKFPLAPAKRSYTDSDNINEFSKAQYYQYTEKFEITLDECANLLMSLSGVINQIHEKNLKPTEVKQFLIQELTPFFGGKLTQIYCMDMMVWTQQRIPRPELSHTLQSHL